MFFLIDENLPVSLAQIFEDRGHSAECVAKLKQLRGQPDEVVFSYAVQKRAIIVTRDLEFGNPFRFNLPKVEGIIILRFSNDISILIWRGVKYPNHPVYRPDLRVVSVC